MSDENSGTPEVVELAKYNRAKEDLRKANERVKELEPLAARVAELEPLATKATTLEAQIAELTTARQADAARVVQRLGKVDGVGMRVRHGRSIDGAFQRLRGLRADPAAGDVALELRGHGLLLEGCADAARARPRT